jgi:4-hydroxy-2-oxoheptanedioate aldolase
MQEKTSFKKRLKNGDFVLGTWCDIPSPDTVSILAKAGLDYVIIDMEHSSMDFQTASYMMMAAEADNCTALVRVPGNHESDVLRALDCGAAGIIVPHIKTAADRQSAISYMKFPPAGVRGYNPFCRWGRYGDPKNSILEENEKILAGVILEDKAAILDLKKVIDDEGLDLIYIGIYDISVALGFPGDINHPQVMKTMEKMVKTIRDMKKAAGAMAHSTEEIDKFKNMGIQFIAYRLDTVVLYTAFHNIWKHFYKK